MTVIIYMKYTILLLLLSWLTICCNQGSYDHEVQLYQKLKLDFDGPDLSEMGTDNPFLNYRLNVTFTNGSVKYITPGYFAADGNAGETSATSGTIWRAWFIADQVGEWSYTVSFRKGDNIAVSNVSDGQALAFDGASGTILVNDLQADSDEKGRLDYVGKRYLQYSESKEYHLKVGPNSPENFLAYEGFDSTYSHNANQVFIKSYEPHVKDWSIGDPTWQDGEGKGIIGSINYIAEMGMNVIYFLTMNIEGDGKDVWPYVSHTDFDRMDCSKLDQWDVVFTHMEDKGVLLHFVLQETENELLLDGGDTGPMRKLYFRELIARFGHHLEIVWNLGEENGPAHLTPEGQNTRQRKDMADYIKLIDPYNHPVVVHTHSWIAARDFIVDSLYHIESIDGLSLQIDKRAEIHTETVKYIEKSKAAGKTWYSPMDEIGFYWMGAMPDAIDPDHDTLRHEVLWGHLLAGGPGVEWYFGYKFPPADLDCEDWRSRDLLWKQSKIAVDFFKEYLPYADMMAQPQLIKDNGYCFADPGQIYVIYNAKGNMPAIDLSAASGEFSVEWFDPKSGGELMTGIIEKVSSGQAIGLGNPPVVTGKENTDWVVILRKQS